MWSWQKQPGFSVRPDAGLPTLDRAVNHDRFGGWAGLRQLIISAVTFLATHLHLLLQQL